MAKHLLALLLALLPALASADGEIKTRPPESSGGASLTGVTCTLASCTFTVPILGPAFDNCAAVPYSFTGDTTTGLCSSADGVVHLRSNGVNVFTVSGTAVTSTVPFYGAAADDCTTPPFSFTGQTTTGVCSSAAGTLNLRVAGVNQFAQTATGISTTIPVNVGGTLSVVSGVTGQRVDVYKTFTSATNFERMFLDAGTNPLAYHIGADYGSTGGTPRQIVFGGGMLTSDVAAPLRQVQGKSAYSQATVNTTGGNVILAGGLGRRFYTIVTFGSTGAKTFTITANGSAVVLTEGATFQCVTAGSNNACATNLATAINADATLGPLMTATPVAAVVYLDKKTTLYSLTIATNAGAPATATSGADGSALFVDGTASVPSLGFASDADGTGTGIFRSSANSIGFVSDGGTKMTISGFINFLGGITLTPGTTDASPFGGANNQWQAVYVSRSLQGSKTKALVETSATTFATVAVPQTAGANFAGGEVIYTVYETDGTDSTTLSGRAKFAAVNKAGTESCAPIADIQTTAISTGAMTLACTMTCVTGLTDVVGLAMNCTDAGTMTQTILNILARFDMPQPNTLVFP